MGKENQNLISLVIDTQNDVEGAFEKLYHESFRHAYCTASLLLKNEQDVEDVLQNSYMYVAKYIKDLKNPESFNNWLGVIVKHECQKYISKQKRISDIFIAVKKTKESDLTDECNLPVDYIEKSETRDAIQRIVDDLPDDKRACVVLFYYEQHSLTEISEILGVPEGTVMSRLFYARKKLEKEFKKLQKKDESLFGISIIPLIVSLFAYQAKTVVIPTAVKNGIVAAVTAEGAAAVTTTATAAVGSSTAAVSTVSASTAVGAAGTAVATKVTAVAVATSVAIGGGVATVNHIKNNNEPVTTQTSVTSTVEYATFANVIVEETTELFSVSETANASSNVLTASKTQTVSKMTSEHSKTTTAKLSTTAKATTTNPTTTNESTTKGTTKQTTTEVRKTETTTQKETTTENITTTELTTSLTEFFNVSDGVLSEYTGDESSVSIPSKVGSSNVIAIGTGAFMGNTNITTVSIPSTVTRIGMEAFSDCTNLRSISLPSSLQSIGIGAFCNCTSLTNVDIPSGVTSIGDDAFADCTKLSSITIPSSVVSIGDNAFGGCNNLVINCSEGSAAYNYAIENSINYSLV